MTITRHYAPACTLSEFTTAHRLDIHVRRSHPNKRGNRRFIASLSRQPEAVCGRILSSCCGWGNTEHEAIADLAATISGQRLVFNAYTPKRHEIDVPTLIGIE